MHEGARRRLYELARELLDRLVITDRQLIDIPKSFSAFEGLGTFIGNNMGDWIQDDWAWFYAFASISSLVHDYEYPLSVGALLDATTAEQRDELAESVCVYWDSVPRSYTFAFPLPALNITDEVALVPGVSLGTVPVTEVDGESMQMGTPLGGLLGLGAAQACPALKVVGKGLIELHESTEVPAASAIRTAKVVLQLARVANIFDTAPRNLGSPKYVTYSETQKGSDRSGRIPLPSAFASALSTNSLARSIVPQVGTADFQLQFSRIARVLDGDVRRRSAKEPSNNDKAALNEFRLTQHCARIATAAEWLFDAVNENASAIAFVQIAIGFEALYGGDGNDPVKKTLSNRVAYSLGKTPGERDELGEQFLKFYDTRSRVVHSGASRLSSEQRKQFEFGKQVLNRCLQHELALIPIEQVSLLAKALMRG